MRKSTNLNGVCERVRLILLAVAVIALVSAQSAEAAELYSENFEGSGSQIQNFGYAPTNNPPGGSVGASTGTGSRAAKLGQGGGNQSANRAHGLSLGNYPIVTYTADAFIPADNNGADQGYGLAKASSRNTLTQVTIYPKEGDWILDTSGLFGDSSTTDAIGPISAGQLTKLSLSFDTVNNTVTGSVDGNSFTKSVPNLATELNTMVNTTIQNINGGGVAMDLDNLVLSGVPEPSTVVLLSIGLVSLFCGRRRKVV